MLKFSSIAVLLPARSIYSTKISPRNCTVQKSAATNEFVTGLEPCV